jgi:DNA relaxase NicK
MTAAIKSFSQRHLHSNESDDLGWARRAVKKIKQRKKKVLNDPDLDSIATAYQYDPARPW